MNKFKEIDILTRKEREREKFEIGYERSFARIILWRREDAKGDGYSGRWFLLFSLRGRNEALTARQLEEGLGGGWRERREGKEGTHGGWSLTN